MPKKSWFPVKNKHYQGVLKSSHWRRLSLGSWGAQKDPTIYAAIELNIEPALQYIEKIKINTGERITITHFIGKAWGLLLRKHPELNSELRLGRFYHRAHVDIAFQVAIDGLPSAELSTGIVRGIDQKDLHEIAKILNRSAHVIRNEDDPDYRPLKQGSRGVPGIFLRPLLALLKFILNTLNLWSPLLGLPKDSFGSIMITNVGSIGLDWAFPALFPPANHPGLIAIGAIYQAPIYETDDQGVVLKTRLERHIRMCGAFDHRYVDGLHASKMAREMRKIFADPDSYQV